MATLHFELVAPERVLFSGEVDAVMLPGTEGDMTVLPGHAPVMTALKTGFLVITDQPGPRPARARPRRLRRDQRRWPHRARRARPAAGRDDAGEHRPGDPARRRCSATPSQDQAVKEAAEAAIEQLREARAALKF